MSALTSLTEKSFTCESSTMDWSYRAEGNSSLVVANTAKRVIYRLRKVSAEERKSPVERVKTELEHQISFKQNVMSPLIGPSYLVPSKLVKLSDEFFEAVKHYTDDSRPDHRRSKTLDVGCLIALELPDLCTVPLVCTATASMAHHIVSGSTFAVEVKPKWGYLRSLEDDIRGRVCRFCMHQFLKVTEGRWKSHSGYCPVDLFSGCTERMTFALQELFKAPQNNLRLFKNGSVIWSSDVEGDIESELSSIMSSCSQQDSPSRCLLDRVINIAVQCLQHDVASSSKQVSSLPRQTCHGSALSASHLCCADCHQLPQHSVLARILTTQQLNDLDFEQIVSLHSHLSQCFDNDPRLRELSGIDGPFTSDWLKNSDGLAGCSDSTKESLLRIKEFLVSRSAKDCSVFISVCPVSSCCGCVSDCNGGSQSTLIEKDPLKDCVGSKLPPDLAQLNLPDRHFVVVDSAGQYYICCVSIIDLDPKRFDKIPFYLTEEQTVVNSYSKLIGGETIYAV